jgi:CubicO group peptidase (beta-lactamase class C family)
MASGMLYSTADDLAKYLSLFFREGPAGGKQVLGSSSLREMLMPVAVSPDWTYGSTIGFSVNPFPEGTRQMQQIHYKPGGCAGFSSVVIINYQRKLGMALLTNTYSPTAEKPDPFWIGYPLLRKLTPVLVKSLERTEDQMRKEMLPKWQTYTGRYVITDISAVRILTFSEYDVSIKNQKLVVNVPELLPGSFVYMKEIPLSPYGENVFRVGGSSFGGDLMTFESNEDGSMMLKWRNYSFKRQP